MSGLGLTTSKVQSRRKRLAWAALALLPPLAALLFEATLWPLVEPYAWILFYPAIFASYWIGGSWAGFAATVISSAAVLWFFALPERTLVTAPGQYFPVAAFFLTSFMFGIFLDRLRQSDRRRSEALDVSERANQSLKKALDENRLLAALVDNSRDFIGIADPSGKPVYLNPAGRRMVGLPPDFPVDTVQIRDFFLADRREFADAIVKATAEEGHWHGETSLRHWQTQEPVPVSNSSLLIRNPESGEVLGIATVSRDISEIRRASDDLQRANEEITRLYEKAKEVDVLKTRFFANVSHELRTPLALILGPTERLLRAPDTPAAVRGDLGIVARNARLLLGHVNELLDAAKLEAGRLRPEYAETDLARLVSLVADNFQSFSSEKGVAFKIERPRTLLAQVDPEKVERILLNLLSNAFKFTPAGGRVRLTLRESAERVFFEVADSGPGIPHDKQEAVFERFRQLEGATTRRFGGSGLGLSIAREFAVLHGGTTSVSEGREGGASFLVELPRDAPPGVAVRPLADTAEVRTEVPHVVEKLRAGHEPAAATAAPATSALVLVVEDNPEMSRFLAGSLSDRYRVAVAFDGVEGLDKARALKPDVILSDLMMSGIGGEDLVHAVRRCPELDLTPIVIVTGKADEELRVRLLREGAQEFLTKPISMEELRARLAILVGKKVAEEAARQAEERFRGIISVASDAIVSIDDKERIVVFNKSAENLFGWSRDEAVGKPLDILIPERFREAHRQYLREFAADEAPARPMVGMPRPMVGMPRMVVGKHKNGEEFTTELAVSKLRVGDGWLFTAILRDVTEQERLEKEEKFLAEMGSVLASTLDYEATVNNVVNLLVRDLADLTIIETLEGTDERLRRFKVAHRDPGLAEPARVLEHLEVTRKRPHLGSAVLDTKQPLLMNEVSPAYIESVVHNEEHRRALREIAPKHVLSLPLLAHGRILGAMILVRNTARPYTQGDLRLATEMAKMAALAVENARLYEAACRAARARDDLLGVVAHELRNPLNTIVMEAEDLRAEPDSSAQKPAESIHRSALRMNRLIQDLLEVTRMEAGRLSLEMARVSPHQLVSDSMEAQRGLVASAALDFRSDVVRDLPDIRADRNRMLQVFGNLIGNAVKFTKPGGRVTVGAESRRGEVVFWVADSGSGISPENMPSLFARFWQARKDQRGVGLGLTISKGIVEAHGGRIWAESTPGRGSTFFFTIPTAAGAEATGSGRADRQLAAVTAGE